MYAITIDDREHEVILEDASITINGKEVNPDLVKIGENKYHLILNDQSYNIEISDLDTQSKTLTVKVNGVLHELGVKDRFDRLLDQLGMDYGAGAKVNEVKAPMPGLVLSVEVDQGQEVKKGEPLLILEAMKMENVLKAPSDGVVEQIAVGNQDKVEKNQVLLTLQ